jgi:hypothetical protein
MTEEQKHHEGHTAHTPAHEAHTAHAPAHTAHPHSAPHSGAAPQITAEIPKVDFKGVTPDSLKKSFMDAIEILKWNKTKIDEVAARDSEGIGNALIFLAVGSIAASLGSAIFGYSLGRVVIRTPIVNALIGAVIAIVIAAVYYYITNLVAVNLFKGKGKFAAYFRVMGYASLLNVLSLLTMVSFVGGLAGIYVGIFINFLALNRTHKLDTTNTILTMLVSAIAVGIVVYILGLIGLSAVMGGGMMGGMMGGIGGSAVTVTY